MIFKENPFAFGKIVKGRQFFNRKKERAEIAADIYNHQNVILYAPRRYGKTSLILNAFDDIKKKNKKFIWFYIDFYKVNSVSDFLTLMSDEYAKKSGLSFEKILTSLKNIVRGITPNLTIDNNGKPTVEISVAAKSVDHAFEDVMKLPEKLTAEGKLVSVFFDEFQEVISLNSFNFQKKLRAYIQNQQNVSYIFCGSKQHLFQTMFSISSNPLFKIGNTRYLDVIPEKEYTKFIFNYFSKIKNDFTKDTARMIYNRAGKIPYNIQFLCHHLYNLSLAYNDTPISKLLDRTFETIIENKSEEFLFIYDSLSISARRALEIILKHKGKNLFNKNILSEYLIPSSTLKKAIENLLDKGLIYKEQQIYFFQDVFFEKWFSERMC